MSEATSEGFADVVRLERRARVAIVTLDRPSAMNALDTVMRRVLRTTLDDIARDPDIGAVVLTGAGNGFCAGSDLRGAAASADDSVRRVARTMLHDIQPIIELITRMEKPVIAAINGPAVGVGMSIALACDVLVMASDAYLLAPFTNLGLIPDGGTTWLLTRQIGYARAMEVLMDCQKLDATRCQQLGIVNRVVEPAGTLEAAFEWATRLTARAPLALALTKRVGRLGLSMSLSETLTLEAEMQTFLARTDDSREAVAAFGGKRKPSFKGS